MKIEDLSPAMREKLEAAAFRRLVAHLDSRKDAQNIDLMNLAGFCRNCLSKWYVAAGAEQQLELDYEDARTHIYGRPDSEWKTQFQTEASPEQQAKFAQEMNKKD